MKVAVLGAGAVGTLLAGRLAASKTCRDVFLISSRSDVVDHINTNGVHIHHAGRTTHSFPTALIGVPAVQVDIVCVAVKAPQTSLVADTIRLIQEQNNSCVVVSLQNGLGNVQGLHKAGVVNVTQVVLEGGASLDANGGVVQHGESRITVGGDRSANDLVAILNAAGFPSTRVENVDSVVWGKLLVNVGINAITACYDIQNGRVADAPHRDLAQRAVEEAMLVGAAAGVQLPYADPVGRMLETARATASNTSSMLADVHRGVQTEVDVINGAIVCEGASFGLPTPINAILHGAVSSLPGGAFHRSPPVTAAALLRELGGTHADRPQLAAGRTWLGDGQSSGEECRADVRAHVARTSEIVVASLCSTAPHVLMSPDSVLRLLEDT